MANVYYNEIDAFCATWLRELMKAGHIPDGEIDTRSIADVRADDLRGFDQCHFFAGIGGWAYALRLASWPDDREVWTGSCPCQPWSVAGSGLGPTDTRHLWPTWFGLIRERHPTTIFGEQVARSDAAYWFDLVLGDLESEGYAAGPIDLPACCYGAEHQRLRGWFVADANRERWEGHLQQQCFSVAAPPTFAIDCDTLARARAALAGDSSGLLLGNGLSVAVARSIVHGFGNAIVPQVAQVFIESYLDCCGVIAHRDER